jgi:hypothetical protein
MLLLGTGLVGMGARRWRNRRRGDSMSRHHPYVGALLAGFLAIASAARATPVVPVIVSGAGAPVGIAASTDQLLYSQPYFQTASGTRVLDSVAISGGVGSYSTFAVLPDQIGNVLNVSATSAENYLAISSGLGGFTKGNVYVTAVVGGANVVLSEPTGTTFATLPAGFASGTNRAGIAFDGTGTFNGALIVTGSTGVLGYGSSGNLLFEYTNPLPGTYIEAGAVAPLSYAACPGCLFLVATSSAGGNGSILRVSPGTPSGASMSLFSAGPSNPEGIQFVTANSLANTFDGFSYFVTGFADTPGDADTSTTGAILAYSAAQLVPYEGDFLIPDATTGNIFAFSGANTSTLFSATGDQLEGSTMVIPGEATPVPEPGTLMLTALGLGSVARQYRRRR